MSCICSIPGLRQSLRHKVPHRLLFIKLRSYGLSGILIRWIESFLVGRTQRVSIGGNAAGDWQPVLSGVIQGSVLGLLLLVIYINDFMYGMQSVVIHYADDTTIL